MTTFYTNTIINWEYKGTREECRILHFQTITGHFIIPDFWAPQHSTRSRKLPNWWKPLWFILTDPLRIRYALVWGVDIVDNSFVMFTCPCADFLFYNPSATFDKQFSRFQWPELSMKWSFEPLLGDYGCKEQDAFNGLIRYLVMHLLWQESLKRIFTITCYLSTETVETCHCFSAQHELLLNSFLST